MSLRSPFLNGESTRQSPFRRQNSVSPAPSSATARAATPPASPTKPTSLSPVKNGSLSPEKTSPFARRPSQNTAAGSGRAASPFARPSSGLSIPPLSPSRNISSSSVRSTFDIETPTGSPRKTITSDEEKENDESARQVTPEPSPSPFDGAAYSPVVDAPTNFRNSLRPAPQRTLTSSTATTIKPPSFDSPTARGPPTATRPAPGPQRLSNSIGGYSNIPQPLLRSMRESFEVLDTSNSGAINSASVASMLEQMGMSHDAASIRAFFPPSQPDSLNLARYLDILSSSLGDLSRPEELEAAFSAFDVDDSGQVDVGELREALLRTAPEIGEEDYRISEREVDGILAEFVGRRAFGAKGMHAAKGKGEVFRYRDFMTSVSGGGGEVGGLQGQQGEAVIGA